MSIWKILFVGSVAYFIGWYVMAGFRAIYGEEYNEPGPFMGSVFLCIVLSVLWAQFALVVLP